MMGSMFGVYSRGLAASSRIFPLSIKVLPYITLLGFFFGSSLVASRFSVGQYDPTTYIGLRMVIASLISLVIYWLIAGR